MIQGYPHSHGKPLGWQKASKNRWRSATGGGRHVGGRRFGRGLTAFRWGAEERGGEPSGLHGPRSEVITWDLFQVID